ncbi:MAG: phosphomethylpyrimidine synthase [Desulfitibacter sp. BRH_c19]|nr:MAG: phosphomethylpyrimidine synthase [Desulfitibacter sp. BRH_c19]
MSLLRNGQNGVVTKEMEEVAAQEKVSPEFIRQGVAEGKIVILKNANHSNAVPLAVGEGLRTKVSASVGLYGKDASIDHELEKIKAAVNAGTDAIMDLSVTGEIDAMRKEVLATVSKPVGTLPLYQAMANASRKNGSPLKMTVEDIFEAIEAQAAEGVAFLALHCGTTMDIVERAKREGRIDPLVSYGGSHLIGWMIHNQRENPLYENFDRVLEIAKKYDVTLSFADSMRPGCLADSLDGSQVQELVVLGELVQRTRDAGIQVMVKGPGHVPLNQVKTTIKLQKSLCKNAPYFVFGPLVTDTGVGHDHISAAIGGAVASWAGADFICYVTPAEHIGIPNTDQVREGVVAARIAAHCGDLAKGMPGAINWDLEMSIARKELDWDKQISLAIDPGTAQRIWKERSDDFSSKCTMCGQFCAMEIISQYLNTDTKYGC